MVVSTLLPAPVPMSNTREVGIGNRNKGHRHGGARGDESLSALVVRRLLGKELLQQQERMRLYEGRKRSRDMMCGMAA